MNKNEYGDIQDLMVSYSNLMGFQSQEKYNCFSIHPYSHLGEKKWILKPLKNCWHR